MTFNDFITEWREKLAWAPYCVSPSDYWASVEGTDEAELAQLDQMCEDELS